MKTIHWEKQEIHWHYLENPCQKVEYVKWCDSYCLGIKVIDDQHKQLLDFVNELSNHPAKDEIEDSLFFRKIITQVVDYIKTHFASEEGIMLATGYPGYADHVVHHKNFILNVIKSVKEYEAGKRLVLSKFSHYMRSWVLSHIAIVDAKYIDYYRHIAIISPDGSLLIP